MIATILGSPGAAFALLIAGPATNLSTIATCIKIVGKKSTFIYVGTVFIFALIPGIIADNISLIQSSVIMNHEHMHAMDISVFSYICMFTLLGVLFGSVFSKKQLDKTSQSIQINVKGMTCSHCEESVKKSLLKINGIDDVIVNLKTGEVKISGENNQSLEIHSIIQQLGYKIKS